MIALIDADLVCYRVAASIKENDGLQDLHSRIDGLMQTILFETQADSYVAFLTGSDNFRKIVNPNYKANRKDQEPPVFLQDARAYLVEKWNAKLGHWLEADDLMGINQSGDTVICSLDKDMRMVPGRHYSWEIRGSQNGKEWVRPAEHTVVTQDEGDKFFWRQMLIGDKTDHIFGVNKIGPVKSANYINHLENNQECMEVVLDLYEHDYHRFAMNAFCLWIKQNEDLEWHEELHLILPDPLKRIVDTLSESMKFLNQDI